MITVAADVGDPSATRTVYLTVVVLAALGVLLAGLAVWVLRRTKPEPELLSPLETMDTRSWRKLDPAAQRRLLDEARPPGASPLRREASEPAVDTSFATVAPVASFDDLSEDLAHADDPADPADDQADSRGAAGVDDEIDPERLDEPEVRGNASGQGPTPEDEPEPGGAEDDETEETARVAVPADGDTDDHDDADGDGTSGADGDDDADHEVDDAVSIDPLLTSQDRSSDVTN